MQTLGTILLAFAAVQTVFIGLDLLTLRHDVRAGAAPALRGVRWPVLLFLAGVWAVYFAIQTALLALAPDVDALGAALARALGVDAAGAHAGTVDLAVVVAGFWDYAFHRFLLHARWGFFLHENHHLPTIVANGMPGISVRPFVAVTTVLSHLGTTATMLALFALGGAPALAETYVRILPGMVLVLTVVGSASHSAFLRKFPLVHHLMRPLFLTTPQEHLLHHAAALQGNYGNFTTLWDRVFGTYLAPAPAGAPAVVLGLGYDQDFLGTLTLGRVKIPAPVRERYRLGAFCHLHRRAGAENEEPSR